MIKFEKDNYIMYFEDADAAAKWLAKENDEGGQFEDLINEVYYNFGSWINDNWTAYEMLCESPCYDELYREWFSELAYGIYYNHFEYFTNEDEDIEE